MFHKVLVANRGEIACRVIRALRELGIAAVAVHSDADAVAKHVRMADEAVAIGPAPSTESYLLPERIIEAARRTGAQAIHPGYGFLSESDALRRACDESGIVFIGPTVEAMRVMGNKTAAREAMRAAGVPIVPGTVEAITDVGAALAEAADIGFPILLKAAAGGGGKGMRLVDAPEDFADAFETCSRVASSAFGDGSVYMERAIQRPRHIEIQLLCDRHGNSLHLFDRECSVQRRHQKVVEESPAANLSDATRAAMGDVAVAAARAIRYEGAGTVEFLVDAQENFYFLEMNTRLQVEHPVTEMVTGVDLVVAQIRIAAGEPLGFSQADLRQRGHAVECRLYAEDPYQGYLPSPGPLRRYRPPGGPGVRVDDGVDEGDVVSSHYDPLVAKIVTWAETRPRAIARMSAALAELRVAGIQTNADLLGAVMTHPPFVEGVYATDILESLVPMDRPELPDATLRLLVAVGALHHANAGSGAGAAPPEATQTSGWARSARHDALRRWEPV